MPAIGLTPAERNARRGEAHHLHPVVTIGADGLNAAVLKEADAALTAHGLIKLRVFNDDRAERDALLARLADTLNAVPVQHIGKLLVLWRPLPAKSRAERDPERRAGPRIVKIVKFGSSPTHRPQLKTLRVLGNQRVTAGGSIKRAKRRQTSLKKKAGAQR
jgi:putative YhbY family RNA-binding protein